MRTLAFQSASHADRPYLVIMHTAAAPDPEEWQGYVEAVSAAAASVDGQLHAFVVTDGGGPSSTQRKDIADAFAQGIAKATTHVFTTSSFVRGIVTAFHWMNWSPAEAHHPNDFGAVCVRCGLPPRVLMSELEKLQLLLPEVQLLKQIKAVVSKP